MIEGIAHPLQPISAKVRFGSELRRITSNGVFSNLQQDISQLFSIPIYSLVLQYTDDEGDLVTMSSQSELEEALKFTTNNLLRVVASLTVPEPQRTTQTQTQITYPEIFPIREEACKPSSSSCTEDFRPCYTPDDVRDSSCDRDAMFGDLLRIKLEIAETKAKIHLFTRASIHG